MVNNQVLQLLLFSTTSTLFVVAQDETLIEGNYNDPSLVTQTAFVEELLYVAGYVPEKIEVYQSLPNYSHVFRVKLDSVTGGFVFVRWDKQKKQHYVANKMIDPGVYYNLKSAQEIMRKQTQNASFSVEDGTIVSKIVDISESPSGFHRLDAIFSLQIRNQKNLTTNLRLIAQNILNTDYRDYLNRMRYYSSELGRNLQIQLNFNY